MKRLIPYLAALSFICAGCPKYLAYQTQENGIRVPVYSKSEGVTETAAQNRWRIELTKFDRNKDKRYDLALAEAFVGPRRKLVFRELFEDENLDGVVNTSYQDSKKGTENLTSPDGVYEKRTDITQRFTEVFGRIPAEKELEFEHFCKTLLGKL